MIFILTIIKIAECNINYYIIHVTYLHSSDQSTFLILLVER